MREILYRGRSLNNGKWIIGDSIRQNTCRGKCCLCMSEPGADWGEVDPDTVGQYIGKLDMSKNQIFEGDILYAFMPYGTEIGKVVYNRKAAGYYLENNEGLIGFDELKSSDIVIVGNIYDNPDLLEVR